MDKVYIGKIVSTHGIKGEVKIKSDFPYKDKVFVIGGKLIIDDNIYVIKSYRVHKNFDMVTLNDYQDINEVLFLLKKDVYVLKEDLNLQGDEILDSDLITFKVLTNEGKEGIIKEVFMASETNKVLRVLFDKEVLIPYNSPMIESVDKENKVIKVRMIDGM